MTRVQYEARCISTARLVSLLSDITLAQRALPMNFVSLRSVKSMLHSRTEHRGSQVTTSSEGLRTWALLCGCFSWRCVHVHQNAKFAYIYIYLSFLIDLPFFPTHLQQLGIYDKFVKRAKRYNVAHMYMEDLKPLHTMNCN